MLQVYHSNRLEVLAGELARVTAAPLADPFRSEIIVLQTRGMARWVAQQLAQRNGIAARLEFPLPARFLWRMLQVWLPEAPAAIRFDKGALLWRVRKHLPGLLDRPAFTPLGRYLADDASGLKLYRLAQRIADLFDQYLVFRPELVLDWEQGADRHWQAALWRTLCADGDHVHRARLLADLESALTRGEPDTSLLPERVCLFGLSALAPVYVRMLGALAGRIPVHLFFLNPCREYWSDLVDEPGQARRRARARRAGRPDPTGLLDLGNPLLAALGHAGQVFLDQVLELGGLDHDHFVAPRGEGLLQRVQRDLLDLIDPRAAEPRVIAPDDHSLQLHSTHGPLREIQVLHDRLLHLFEQLDDLEPRDIIVMAPDIDRYAPYIEAIFGAAETSTPIPWSLAEGRVAGNRPIVDALRSLLALPGSRFEAGELLSLLEVAAVRRRLGLDDQGLERIRAWVRESGIRWGADGAMRADLDLPDEPANTWDFGLKRLFLGYALPPDADHEPYAGVLPYPDLEGSEVADLGRLAAFIEALDTWRRRLATPRGLAGWRSAVNELLATFFAPDDEEAARLQPVRDGLDEAVALAGTVGFDQPVTLDVLRALIRDALEADGGAQRFLTGRIDFCNLVPMRSIPFRVVCLIGLNGADFPRTQRPLSFDLMARHPRRGDRSRRRDDRYLFLEALLSARDILYLSWIGNDERDNSLKVPSVVIDELLDYLRRGYRLPDGADPAERLVLRHPLQPFSRRYFDAGDQRLFSYGQTWLAAARTRTEAGSPPFFDTPLPEPDETPGTLALEEPIHFLRDPAHYFLTQRLGLKLSEETQAPPDTEPFDAEQLERYQLDQTLLHGLLAGQGRAAIRARLRGAGDLPHGAPGELLLDARLETAAPFVQRLQAQLTAGMAERKPLEVDLPLAGLRLQGRLGNLRTTGLLDYRLGRLNAKDRLRAWVRHLILNLLAPPGIEPASSFIARDRTLRLTPVADAEALLADLLALRRQGLCRPLAFFPESALAWWIERKYGSGFEHAWCGRHNPAPERDRIAVRIAFRGRDPIGEEFEQTARRILEPMLAHTEETTPDTP
ncbi:MAG: exodeoxyribonuclease V subunit gamma [Candidatus Thiosymbion ectosymbiont of Robbea hypermnestra]|nr:exodeoxyribonuclease V subunit gamma [Candidatus Thiosymbion ectosymbiont of Robbea hypermnestra]